jgi:HEAT repeat protein
MTPVRRAWLEHELDPAVLPHLLARLEGPELTGSLTAHLQDQDAEIRGNAAAWLASLGVINAEVQGIIFEAAESKDPAMRRHAISGLLHLEKAGAAALQKLLSDPDLNVRIAAALAMADQQPLTDAAAAVLVQGFRIPDTAALVTPALLSQMGQSADGAKKRGRFAAPGIVGSAVAKALREEGLRQAASDFLRSLGSAASAAVPELIAILDSDDADARAAAAMVLQSIGDRAVPALLRVIERGGDEQTELAVGILKGIGPAAEPDLLQSAAKWSESLKSREVELRKDAASRLGLIGPLLHIDPPSSVDLLMQTRGVVTGGAAVDMVLALAVASTDRSPAVREAADEALKRIGPPAVAALLASLTDRDPEVRSAAAAALGNIAPPTDEVLNALATLKADRESRVRGAAIRAIRLIDSRK